MGKDGPRGSGVLDGARDRFRPPGGGRWTRFFTPRATRLFQMDAWAALEDVTKNYGDVDWEGECEPR